VLTTAQRALAAGAAVIALALPAAAHAQDRLPDLDQVSPSGFEVARVGAAEGPLWHLGFDSAVNNVGEGPLVVDARRPSTREPNMRADQLVQRSDGTLRRRPGVGRLRFVVSPDHNHWHYLDFDRFELRRTADYRLVAPDRKTGFCLGDRYASGTPGIDPGEPRFVNRCGLRQRGLLSVQEGITPGFGDDYGANLEGQFVDITAVPAGRYYLVHRVNADKKLLESRYSNDAGSVLLSIGWPRGPRGAPKVKVLQRCGDADRCPRGSGSGSGVGTDVRVVAGLPRAGAPQAGEGRLLDARRGGDVVGGVTAVCELGDQRPQVVR
jgi:Lysyl oxidase